jgi:hypothetical protein
MYKVIVTVEAVKQSIGQGSGVTFIITIKWDAVHCWMLMQGASEMYDGF